MESGARARGLVAGWARGPALGNGVCGRRVATAKESSAYTRTTTRSVNVGAQSASARCAILIASQVLEIELTRSQQMRKPLRITNFSGLSRRGSSIGGGVGVGFFAYQQADLTKILVDFAIGLEERSLVVGDVMRAAVVADDFLNLAEFVGGHSGKKVVFDLAG